MSGLRILDAPDAADVPPAVPDFLRALGTPTALRVRGRDRGRCRVLTTLLHGNEPSGLRALHGWLREGRVPATDALLIVAAVPAALAPPGFAHRSLPGHADLNRCFLGPFHGAEGALARQILDAIAAAAPEAVLDLHNNTGHSPAYGVGPAAGPRERGLARLFGDHFVHTRLEIGALVEAVPRAITVECGRAGSAEADATARHGLDRYLAEEDLSRLEEAADEVVVLVDPVRVRLRAGTSLAVARSPAPGADFTLRTDVDRHNFARLPAGTRLGWVRQGAPWPLEAFDRSRREISRQLFARRDESLETRRAMIPIMMTTDVAVASSDCLFYAVRQDAAAG